MSVTIVAGVQWGDEGKGKTVDYLAAGADVVIRGQGGPNAGHTIVNEHGSFALHAVPSGIFNPRALNVIGPGVVVDPIQLAGEIRRLAEAGVDIRRLVLSERAHLIMPYHRVLDRLDDSRRPAALAVGSTGCGIGPVYSDKAARIGIRVGEIRNRKRLRERVELALDRNNALLRLHGQEKMTVDEVLSAVEAALETLAPFIADTSAVIEEALAKEMSILLEGQLGVMRDLDWGPYPFVTSSCPTPAGLAAGAGIPPQAVSRSIGVMKAYTTSVGAGPLPTELSAVDAERLRTMGGEFGATTGRPRRCGWLDLPAARWACGVAGFTEIALTKLDILDTLAEIPVCTGYRRDGVAVDVGTAAFDWEGIEPVYEALPGWLTSTSAARSIDELADNAKAYVDYCARFIGRSISMIGVGPEREAIISDESNVRNS